MNVKCISILLSIAACGGVGADDTIDYSQYVQFLWVNTSHKDYCFSRRNGWSSGEAPASGYRYYVPAGKVLASEYSDNDPHTFKGDELAIAGGFLHVRESGSGKTTKVPVFALCNGGYFTCGVGNKSGLCPFSSPCTIIRSTGSAPAQFRFPADTTKTSRPTLLLDVHGGEDAEFEFVNTGTGSSELGFHLDGAFTNYSGTVTIAEGARPRFSLADNAIPSVLKVCNGGVLDTSLLAGDVTVGSFVWADGGVLSVPVTDEGYAKIVVTNVVQVEGVPRLTLAGLSDVSAGTPPSYPIMTLAGQSAESVPDLSRIAVTPVVGALPKWKLVVAGNDDGTKTVSATYAKEIVTLCHEYSSTTAKFSALYDGNEHYWSNNEMPKAGYDYYITSNMLWHSGGPGTFAGDSFTIASGKTVRGARDKITINDMHMLPDAAWTFSGGNDMKYLSGGITIWPGASPAVFKGYNSRKGHIQSSICGDGDITFTTATGNDTPRASYSLEGANSTFCGRVTITTPKYAGSSSKDYPATPNVEADYYTTVQIRDCSSLGGAYSGSDSWRAVTVEGCSRLTATNDIALSEPTRGIFISNVGYVQVDEKATLSLDCPLTLGGRLVKVGGGTLSLGGRIAFIDGDPATPPAADTNRLVVSDGALKVVSTNACNGMEILFEEGCRLVLGIDSGDETLAENGLYNVAWDSPVLLAEGMAALPVEFALPPDFDHESSHRFGICTFNPGAAASFSVDSFAVRRVPHMSAKVIRVENRDGSGTVASVTFACDLVPAGFRVLVR